MGMKVTKEAVEVKQEKLKDLAMKILALAQSPGDHGDEIVKMAEQAQKEGQELEAMALVWQQQVLEEAESPRPKKCITVELTDGQRKRIMDETGVRMETVQIEDTSGVWTKAMPSEVPPDIEAIALKQARRKKAVQEGEETAKEEATQGIDALRAQNNPDMDKLVDKALQDPNFLDGMMSDKE